LTTFSGQQEISKKIGPIHCYLPIVLSLHAKIQKKIMKGLRVILKNANFWAKIDILTSFSGQQEFSKKIGHRHFCSLMTI